MYIIIHPYISILKKREKNLNPLKFPMLPSQFHCLQDVQPWLCLMHMHWSQNSHKNSQSMFSLNSQKKLTENLPVINRQKHISYSCQVHNNRCIKSIHSTHITVSMQLYTFFLFRLRMLSHHCPLTFLANLVKDQV